MFVRPRPWLAAMLLSAACGGSGGGAGDTGTTGTATATGSTGAATVGTTGDPTAGTSGSSGAGSTGGTGAGCGTALSPGASTHTLTVAGKERSFLFVVPDGYDPSAPAPLVFAWHARGGTSELARLYYRVEEASGGAALFVYPQGLPQPNFGNDTGWDLSPTGEDVAFFDAMLDFVRQQACVDEGRIFSTGHSFGAYMSNIVGCARGGTVRAIGVVAGGGPFFGCGPEPVAAWIAHGMSDQVVPFTEGEGSRDYWRGKNGCGDATVPLDDPAPCVEYQGCTRGFPVVFCPHDEPDLQGHGWPSWAGPAIWDFFARF